MNDPHLDPAMPDDAYHADPCPEPSLSAGDARKLLASTPWHTWTESRRLNPDAEPGDNAKFVVGTVAHAVMTGVGKPIHRIEAPDFRTKAAQAERDAAAEDGMTPILAKDHDRVLDMVASARRQMAAMGIGDPFAPRDRAHNEASIFWRGDGVWNRCRPDCIDFDAGIVWDLKTTGLLASPERWGRTGLRDHGIDIRAAHYLDGAEEIEPRGTGPARWRYRFVVVEDATPYALSVMELDDGTAEIGARKVREARAIWRECLDTGRWPGWPAHIVKVSASPHDIEAWLDRESRHAEARRSTPSRRLIDAYAAWQAPHAGAAE